MNRVKYYRRGFNDPRISINFKALKETLDENSLDNALHCFVWDIYFWRCLINNVDDIIERYMRTQDKIYYRFEYIDCMNKLLKCFKSGDFPNVLKLYDQLDLLEKDILKNKYKNLL